MVHLVNLIEVSSNIYTQSGVKPPNTHLRSLFEDLWLSVGHQLRSLTLGAAVSQYEYFLLDNATFSSLKRLQLDLHHASNTPAGHKDSLHTNLTTGILSWLTSASNQLESLALTFLGPISLSSEFLDRTPIFPRLGTLSLLLPSNATAASIHNFLQHCVAGLHTLNLNFGHFALEEIEMTDISDCLRHSQVETLIIRPQISSLDPLRGAEALGEIIYAVRESVTCVVANTDEWSTTEEFLPLFTALSPCHLLRHLDIQITFLNAPILGKLARSLPRLDSLSILHRMHYRSPHYVSTPYSMTGSKMITERRETGHEK